jgi:hypothetical protein
MDAVVVYESMYGNTRQLAHAIAKGIGGATVIAVADANSERLAGAELVVAGGPTHMLGMSGPNSRRSAVAAAAKPGSGLTVEPGASGPGIREWLADARGRGAAAAAFDSRLRPWLAGRAAPKIARGLRRRGFHVIDRPRSFLVSKQNQLLPGELERARAWGASLVDSVRAAGPGAVQRPK